MTCTGAEQDPAQLEAGDAPAQLQLGVRLAAAAGPGNGRGAFGAGGAAEAGEISPLQFLRLNCL
jgi:hypothetical protein